MGTWKFFTLSLVAAMVVAAPSFASNDSLEQLQTLLDSSRYDEAMDRGLAVIESLRRDDPDGSQDEAEFIDLVVNACYRSNRVMEDQYVELGLRAVRLREQVGPDAGPPLAKSLLHLAQLYRVRAEFDQAIPVYERALRILVDAGPQHDPERAKVLDGLGVINRRLGNYGKGLQYSEEALRIQEISLGTDHPDVAVTLNNLGIIKLWVGDYSQSRDLHLRALSIREKHFESDSEWIGETLNNLANALAYMGEYKEALDVQERAVAILKSRLGTDHQRYWWTYFNLGVTYLDMGDYEGAQPICEEVLAALQQRYGSDHVETTFALDALASCRFNAGDYEGALDLYLRSLTISEAAFGVGNPETADTIEQKGRCLVELGRLEEAAESLRTSLEIREASVSENSPELCELLHYLAKLNLRMDDPEHALEYARRSQTIVLTTLGEDHPLLAEALVLEARGLRAEGSFADVIRIATRAEDISRRHLQATMGGLSEHHALEYAASRTLGLDLALSSLDSMAFGGDVDLVWDAVIRSRAVVLDEFTARNKLRGHLAGTDAASLADSSLVLRERLANLVMRGPGWEEISLYRRMLDDTREELNQIERRLSVASDFFRETKQSREVGLAQVRAALPPQTSLVSFVRYRKIAPRGSVGRADFAYKALVLGGPGTVPTAVELGDAEEVDALIEDWRDQVRFGHPVSESDPGLTGTRGFVRVSGNADRRLDDYLTAATALRRRVWDPLTPWFKDSRQVFLVPDGNLNLISFPALPGEKDRFLVEQDPLLHIVVTERSLAGWNSKVDSGTGPAASTAGGLLVVGDPDFGAAPGGASIPDSRSAGTTIPGPCVSLSDMRFGPLPWARDEANEIKRIWLSGDESARGPVRIILGSEASESVFKREVGGHEVVHLATHGFFLPGSCDQEQRGQIKQGNPLALSGLVFSGGNRWMLAEDGCNDGILTAQEVAALDLTGVRWVVLSACETGLGALSTQGEGVFGLRRSFALGGAQTVIMSLWAVGDDLANQWMVELYSARLSGGMDTPHAVRAASRAILSRLRENGQSTHPYHWAGFLAAGDWH